LAESTKKYKARHGGSKILQSRDRNLRESTGYHADNDSVIVGVNAYSSKGYPYPIVHQFGSEDGKIVARPFMPITHDGELYDNVKVEVLDILLEYLGE
jgi:phage gpG-like protein